MKQFLAVCVLVAMLSACNGNSGEGNGSDSGKLTTPSTVDSNTVVEPADSTAVEPLVDTVKHNASH